LQGRKDQLVYKLFWLTVHTGNVLAVTSHPFPLAYQAEAGKCGQSADNQWWGFKYHKCCVSDNEGWRQLNSSYELMRAGNFVSTPKREYIQLSLSWETRLAHQDSEWRKEISLGINILNGEMSDNSLSFSNTIYYGIITFITS